ncbi:AmmeMemoRadiSam system protein B [Dehalobacterium formicoaceticum]|uniref:AmmeMemoRadiSam system protein B n=1 Tax=Dehalobacterium formicoaceticum TaxID=51515 RepID=A0ABT1Y201_9FIRM|nr:AmmeMemoRadiSam system protein B [Dehalobacterium formicoaceticum]MCR6544896.1 AmmeMemoRadiSam system protein B [Dehalobacterium formicoaceticum]
MMKKILLVAVIIWAAIAYIALSGDRTGTSVQPGSFPPVHPNAFFQTGNFYTGEFPEGPDLENIRGGVIPHHLVADKLIARVFDTLKDQKPDTIILLGPNHSNEGGRIVTSSLGWQTPFGVVDVDEKLLKSLRQASSSVQVNDEIMSVEHAMGNIMPFIKYYLPETKVLPIIFPNNFSREEANVLGEKIAGIMGDKTVVLASVDFSHYLKCDEAELKDQETIQALKERNLGRIFTMNDDYLDSPAAIGVLFTAMNKLGKNDFAVLNHTNSGVILGNKNIATTSYITLLFGIENK